MAAVLRKMVKDKNDLWLIASMIIIAANAGGGWSPIGDVTAIMLWIGGQITVVNIVTQIFIPSLVAAIVPLIIFSISLKGSIEINGSNPESDHGTTHGVSSFEKSLVFGLGVVALLFAPIFKTITHLPPFMGVLFGLSIMWILTEFLHKRKMRNIVKLYR